MPYRLIDPTNLKPRHSRLLATLLKQGHKTIEKNKPYTINYKSKKKTIHLSHSLVYRESNRDGSPRYSIVDNGAEIGSGGFSTVVRVAGTLLFNDKKESMICKMNKDRVIKIIENPNLKSLRQESTLARLIKELHSKNVTYDSVLNTAFITQKKMPGISLYDFLCLENLSDATRLIVAYNLLIRLRDSIHGEGIIHCDIKPDNIMIDENTLSIKFVDLGLAIETDKAHERHSAMGTIAYIAPEIFNRKAHFSPEVDLYAMGRIFLFIFSKRLPAPPLAYNPTMLFGYYNTLRKNLFPTPTTYNREEINTITEVIDGLNQTDHKHRMSLHEAISKLQITTEDFLLRSKHSNKKNTRMSKVAAVGLIKESNSLNPKKANIDNKILENLEDALTKFTATPSALSLFCRKINFNECKTKSDIIDRYKHMTKHISDYVKRITTARIEIGSYIAFIDKLKCPNDFEYITKQLLKLDGSLEVAMAYAADTRNKITSVSVKAIYLAQMCDYIDMQMVRMKERHARLFYLLDAYKIILNRDPDNEPTLQQKTMVTKLQRYIKKTLTQKNLEANKEAADSKKLEAIKSLLSPDQTTKKSLSEIGFFSGRKLRKHVSEAEKEAKVSYHII